MKGQVTLLLRGMQVLFIAAAIVQQSLAANPLVRENNTTLRLPVEAPGTASGSFALRDAFLFAFDHPVAIAAPPSGRPWLFAVERPGRIIVLTNLANPTKTVFLDISAQVAYEPDYLRGAEGLVSMAFHPKFQENGYFYVLYMTMADTAAGVGMHHRLSRFQVAPDASQALPESQLNILTQRDEGLGHNWNELAFGPDGYLYIAAGDEGGSHDEFQNSQRIDKDLFSGILRIDVDKRPDSVAPNPHPAITANYAIPRDNPFIGATEFDGRAIDPTQVRTELYAIGLRNPWRMAFDPVTGALFCGDVGQHAAEEINVIVKGANYGWAYKEGSLPGFKGSPPPGSNVSFTPPLIEYRHGFGPDEGKTVIGGIFYRGAGLPGLEGAYIFGDFVTGNIWSARYDGQNITPKALVAIEQGIVAFGINPANGDLLVVDHDEQKIKQLIYRQTDQELPPTLADTGAFRDLARLGPHPGIVPYEVNVSFWSDHARKRRWFSIPEGGRIGFHPTAAWSFPTGSVWIKHFELEMTNGIASSARRLETRFLVRTETGIYGATYRWNESQSNALLVPAEGMDEDFVIQDRGAQRIQKWRYPSRAECNNCHTSGGGYLLGFNTAQLNRTFDYGSESTNQLVALEMAGYFAGPINRRHLLPALAPLEESNVSREYRVRSYLAVNCAQCHYPGGTAQGLWDSRITTSLSSAGIVNGPLFKTTSSEERVVKPAAPEMSMILTRMSSLGPDRMPPVGSLVPDRAALDLIADWINHDLPAYETFSDWQIRFFGSTNSSQALSEADPDQDGASNALEFMTKGDPLKIDSWKAGIEKSGALLSIHFPAVANRGYELQFTSDLVNPIWQPLNVPANRPYFAASNQIRLIQDTIWDAPHRSYRIRVFEP